MRPLVALIFIQTAAVAAPRFVEVAASCTGAAWQPNGDRLACTLDEPRGNLSRAGLLIVGSDGRERGFVLGAAGTFAWSPDGKKLAAASQRVGGGRLLFVDADGANGLVADLPYAAIDSPLGWSADAKELWLAHPAISPPGRSDITAVTADGSPSSIQGDGYCAGCSHPALAPDGRLAYLKERTIVVVDRNHAAERKAELPPAGDGLAKDMPLVAGPSWSPDGRFLAVIAMGEKMGTLLVTDTRAPSLRWKSLGPSAGDLSWSPDGAELATALETGAATGKVVAVRVADGHRRDLVLPDAGCRALGPSWSKNGVAVTHACEGKLTLRIYR
jgi:Tol biopolymer transport system component